MWSASGIVSGMDAAAEHAPVGELLAALSLATDLGLGAPAESALRTALLATLLGQVHGLDTDALACTYYGAVLRHVGCTAVAHEESLLAGDDIQLKRALMPADPSRPADVLARVVRGVGRGSPGRFRNVVRLLTSGQDATRRVFLGRCEVAARLAARLGMADGVTRVLWEASERWDGKGLPHGLAAEALSLPSRILMVAEVAALFFRLGGFDAAVAEICRRAGEHFDPSVCTTFGKHSAALLAPLAGDSAWTDALAIAPVSNLVPNAIAIDELTAVLADFSDLKSTYTLGHSPAVAALAEAAGRSMGLEGTELTLLRRAALVHDLGRASVPNSVWDKAGPLNDGDWERVRMHTYYTERILARGPGLCRIGELAASDHERLDGTGYHRRVPGAVLPSGTRVLAAADVYQALLERRPHRPALSADRAADTLFSEVRAGRLDGRAVDAVVAAAGHAAPLRRSTWPAGLSNREVEVLQLVARGLPNKAIADKLGISARTVQHHTIHIYAKIGVETRAAAALFATEHDLLRQ
jgi:HD-GYP domain-containing protein (c-di-GMP phosphodiesterase class II)